jgi:hypothetical protein
MKGAYKQFDPALFASNDERARAAVMHALNHDGMYACPNPDKYGPDICVYSGYRHVSYVECEIKLVWKSGQDTFPWPTIQVPERKHKFTRDGAPATPTGKRPAAHTWKEVEYWVFREDCQVAIIIPEHVLSSSPLVEVPNRYTAKGELFFQVPIEQCIVRSLV